MSKKHSIWDLVNRPPSSETIQMKPLPEASPISEEKAKSLAWKFQKAKAKVSKPIVVVKKAKKMGAEKVSLGFSKKASGEQWKPVSIDGGKFADDYLVSSWGRVKSRFKGGHSQEGFSLVDGFPHGGYKRICLRHEGKNHYKLVHVLVADAFLGPKPEGMECNHIDCNKSNNRVDNLEYVDRAGNVNHARRMREGIGYNGARFLLDHEVEACLIDVESGMSNKDAAQKHGCTSPNISQWIGGTSRTNVLAKRLSALGLDKKGYSNMIAENRKAAS